MDPLSIIASSIAVATTVLAALDIVTRLHGAPVEAEALIREITDLKTILSTIESFIHEYLQTQQNGCEPLTFEDKLSPIIENTRTTLLELDELLTKKCLRRKSNGEVAVKRWTWVKEDTRLGRHRDTLQAAKLNLATMLGVISACGTYRAERKDFEIATLQQELQAARRHIQQHTMQSFLQHEKAMQHLCSRIEMVHSRLDTQSAELIGPVEDRNVLVMANNSASEISTTKTNDLSLFTVTKSSYAMTMEADVDDHCPRLAGYEVPTSPFRRSSADHKCKCCCHMRSSLSTPEMLKFAVGKVCIKYVALPFLSKRCDRRTCKRRSRPVAQVTYFFPQWLLMRMISVLVSIPDLQACNVFFRAPRVVPDNSDLFTFAKEGNLRGIQLLFDSGLASAYDICSTNGASSLTYAIQIGHVKTWRFLLKAGADPYHENKSKQSSMDIAWGRILSGAPRPDIIEALRHDFDAAEYTETRHFPVIHQIVLQITVASLATQIELSAATIDEVDWQGRTALSWAAARGDIKSLRILLAAGADPNLASYNASSPLHFAARAPTPICIQPLLEAGARVDHQNAWLVPALRYVALDRDDPSYLMPLLHAGADLAIKDLDGRTAMMVAIDKNHPKTVKCLLEHGGVIPEEGSVWKARPIITAIRHNQHELLCLILRHNASLPSDRRMSGKDILVTAGANADIETLRILAEAKQPQPVHFEEKDDDDFDAFQRLKHREDLTSELLTEFIAWVEILRAPDDDDAAVESGQDDEEFVEALEFQDEVAAVENSAT